MRRYLKQKGRFPSHVHEALRSFGTEQGVGNKELRAALRLDTRALAAAAGVSLTTARTWKRNKRIPPRSQRFLSDIAPEPVPKQLRGYVREYGAHAKFTKGFEISTVVNAYVTSASVLKMVSWASRLKIRAMKEDPPTRLQKKFVRYQFMFQGSSVLGPKEKLESGSGKETRDPKKLGRGLTQHYHDVPTPDAASITEAVKLLAQELRNVENQSFFVERLTLWVRYPKSENPQEKQR